MAVWLIKCLIGLQTNTSNRTGSVQLHLGAPRFSPLGALVKTRSSKVELLIQQFTPSAPQLPTTHSPTHQLLPCSRLFVSQLSPPPCSPPAPLLLTCARLRRMVRVARTPAPRAVHPSITASPGTPAFSSACSHQRNAPNSSPTWTSSVEISRPSTGSSQPNAVPSAAPPPVARPTRS